MTEQEARAYWEKYLSKLYPLEKVQVLDLLKKLESKRNHKGADKVCVTNS